MDLRDRVVLNPNVLTGKLSFAARVCGLRLSDGRLQQSHVANARVTSVTSNLTSMREQHIGQTQEVDVAIYSASFLRSSPN